MNTLKQVFQFDLKGNKINKFKSITEASKETGVSHECIRQSNIYGYVTSKKYRWSTKEN